MKKKIVLTVLMLMAISTIIFTPFLGADRIPFAAVAKPDQASQGKPASEIQKQLTIEHKILWKLRIPRVLIAFLAGAGLAIGGMAFQALFLNPLATPYTLGVASGASLGAAGYVRLGLVFSFGGLDGLPIAAFLGASLAMLFVYMLATLSASRGLPPSTLLLAGVAISFFFSSLILFIQYISDFVGSFQIIRWLMGGLEVVGFTEVMQLLPFVIIGGSIIFFLTRELDLLMTGESSALGKGVEVEKVKRLVFFATSLMVGGIVAFCGPIGFVGMMAPHICRLALGASHRLLAPASILFGGTFLVWCDTLARSVIAPAELPVGVITALLGGPFFLWLLLGKSRGGLHGI